MVNQKARGNHEPGREGDVSYSYSLERFSKEQVAHDYPSQYRNTARDRREIRGIQKSLVGVPAGAHVLDLPCGSGRLMELLLAAGYKLTCADSSPSMVELAQQRWNEIKASSSHNLSQPRFFVGNVLNTGFADNEFDAVICNRLFHHFAASETRVQALKEFARISKGPIAVSFFNSFSLDAIRFRFKHWLRGKPPKDRIPIPMNTFINDFHQAGLEVVRTIPLVWGISPMWYVVGCRSQAASQSSRRAA